LDEILDEIGNFGRTKNDILDNIFLLSLTMTCPLLQIFLTVHTSPRNNVNDVTNLSTTFGYCALSVRRIHISSEHVKKLNP